MGKPAQQANVVSTEIRCIAPTAKKVFLAGTFNDWSENATAMTKGEDGGWSASLDICPGQHEFKFVIDDIWRCSPDCEDSAHLDCRKCVLNSLGTMNRMLEVK